MMNHIVDAIRFYAEGVGNAINLYLYLVGEDSLDTISCQFQNFRRFPSAFGTF